MSEIENRGTLIQAGEKALEKLREAQELLASAKDWGIADVAGGIFMTSAMKQNKMKDAAACIADAREQIEALGDQLGSASALDAINLDTEDSVARTDLFLDNPVSDVKMLNRIKDAQRELDAVVADLESRLNSLRTEA